MDKFPIIDGIDYTVDIYRCSKIDLYNPKNTTLIDILKLNSSESENKIKFITSKMKDLNLKAIWVIIPIEHSLIINTFTNQGFLFHHVEKDTSLFMYKWLLTSPSNMPKYASHYVGVGALITNKEGKILLAKEKKTLKELKDFWKIPTGLVENGEKLSDAVIREVNEETGLRVEFNGILNMRETYPYMFGTTDIFFICLCSCDGDQKIDIVQGGELKDCKWFDKNEVRQILKEKKCSPFTAKLFKQVLDYLPNGLNKYLWKPEDEVKFLKSKFILYTPKF